MRVKISYTIPVEESLEKSEQFLDESLEQLANIIEDLMHVKTNGLISDQPFRTYERFDELRKKLFEVDANVDNSMSLIKAHAQYVTNKNEASQPDAGNVDLNNLEQINAAFSELNNSVEKKLNDG